MLEKYEIPDLKMIKIEAPFWEKRMKNIAEKVIPYQ